MSLVWIGMMRMVICWIGCRFSLVVVICWLRMRFFGVLLVGRCCSVWMSCCLSSGLCFCFIMRMRIWLKVWCSVWVWFLRWLRVGCVMCCRSCVVVCGVIWWKWRWVYELRGMV